MGCHSGCRIVACSPGSSTPSVEKLGAFDVARFLRLGEGGWPNVARQWPWLGTRRARSSDQSNSFREDTKH